ncbi:MAG TPA: urate hydroxylase PuuD [Gammaproteobacteria bacterium]
MNPLNSIKGTLTLGFVLAIVVALIASMGVGSLNWLVLVRWFHILAGITWIGLLYYFNFVQTPAMADAAADKGGPGGAGISKYVVPRALLWFRMSAAVTWVLGFIYLAWTGNLGAFAFGMMGEAVNTYQLTIGIGAWLGTIMLFNVWVLIWPNQKKVLGIVAASDEEKAKARKVAAMASRTNTMLSIPMLLCMASAFHGVPFLHG